MSAGNDPGSLEPAEKSARRAGWRLHERGAEYEALLQESGGEVTPEVEAAEEALFADAKHALEVAVSLCKEADARMTALKAEQERIADLRASQQALKERAKGLVRRAVGTLGEGRTVWVGPHKVTVSAGSPRVEDSPDDLAAIGELEARGLARVEAEWKFDKREILKALKRGEDVPGFRLVPGKDRVTIR